MYVYIYVYICIPVCGRLKGFDWDITTSLVVIPQWLEAGADLGFAEGRG